MGKRGRRSRETIMAKRTQKREIYDRSPVARILLGNEPAESFDSDVMQLVADVDELHDHLKNRGWAMADYSDFECISWERSAIDDTTTWISLAPTDEDHAPVAKADWLLVIERENTGAGEDGSETELRKFPAATVLTSLVQIEAGRFPMDFTPERGGQ